MNHLVQKCIKPITKKSLTKGLKFHEILPFLETDNNLRYVVNKLKTHLETLNSDNVISESKNINNIQDNFLNFYQPNCIQPYIPYVAKGPWIGTYYGSIIYDCGGYGMLSFGHNDTDILNAISHSQVQANIMTPNFLQKEFADNFLGEIGKRNKLNSSPYKKIVSTNSGSEAIALAARLSYSHCNIKQSKKIKKCKNAFISLSNSFHGRMDIGCRISDSTKDYYSKKIPEFFSNFEQCETVEINDVLGLRKTFRKLKQKNINVRAMFMEPVQGEGCPGLAITPEFYNECRRLTKENGSLLIIDSIQAGLRTTGELSIVDYHGFEFCEPPDIEVFSKAINAGQYPVSIITLSENIDKLYMNGTYGNTMTTNPRGLNVINSVIGKINDKTKTNIRNRGLELKNSLQKNVLRTIPDIVDSISGSGLLLAIHLSEEYNSIDIEKLCRKNGLNVIHGGENAIRLTPHFNINSNEIDLITDIILNVLLEVKNFKMESESIFKHGII